MIACLGLRHTVTLNLFQGLTFSATLGSKMLKQGQHDRISRLEVEL